MVGRSGQRRPRRDLLAGLTTAAVVVPQAVAYASLAGLPVETGLYVALALGGLAVLPGLRRWAPGVPGARAALRS
jgi:sulfate permease, SulP family